MSGQVQAPAVPRARSLRSRLPGRPPLMPTLPLIVLIAIPVLAIAAPLITPFDPVRNSLIDSKLPPFWVHGGELRHPLGTDGLGRDVFARLLYGARVSIGVAALSLAIAVTIGTTIGVVAGYVGGWIGSATMRFVDMILSLPMVLIALALAIALGPSFTNMVLVIGLLIWPRLALLIRAETRVLKEQEFVRYARAIGVPAWRIVLMHILPNVLSTLLVAVALEIPHVILVEASLSFLGAGIPPPSASWGVMIADGRALIATGWWIALFPGLAIITTVVSFNALGDWMRDHFDPRLKQV
jgi:ABC-type dipeptide/oligopeptide/nickel transport system permease subunit